MAAHHIRGGIQIIIPLAPIQEGVLIGNPYHRRNRSTPRRSCRIILHMDAEQATRLGKHLQLTERDSAERGRDSRPRIADRASRPRQRSSEDRSTHQREPNATRQHRGTQGAESSTAV